MGPEFFVSGTGAAAPGLDRWLRQQPGIGVHAPRDPESKHQVGAPALRVGRKRRRGEPPGSPGGRGRTHAQVRLPRHPRGPLDAPPPLLSSILPVGWGPRPGHVDFLACLVEGPGEVGARTPPVSMRPHGGSSSWPETHTCHQKERPGCRGRIRSWSRRCLWISSSGPRFGQL